MVRRGSKSRNKKQHAMQIEDAGGQDWSTAPIVEAENGETMDTTEPQMKAIKAITMPKIKQHIAKRGNRTSAQKKRKQAKLQKALAVGSRFESKNLKLNGKNDMKKSLKSLWTDKDH